MSGRYVTTFPSEMLSTNVFSHDSNKCLFSTFFADRRNDTLRILQQLVSYHTSKPSHPSLPTMVRALPAIFATLILAETVVADDNVFPLGVPPVIQSIAGDLSFDGHNRLSKTAFVYDASNPACEDMVKSDLKEHFLNHPAEMERIQWAGLEGHAFDQVLGPYQTENSGCMAACIERGTDRDLAGYVMPGFVYDSAIKKSLSGWFSETCSRKEVCLMNYHSVEHPLSIYWKNFDGEFQHLMNIPYGNQNTVCFHSFLGHEFSARDDSTDPANPKEIGTLTVEFVTVKAWGESPPSDERAPSHDFDAEIETTLQAEWIRHHKIKRTFSPLGFKKWKLPNDVYASIGAFYYNNAQNVVREEWTDRGVYVNWWETDVLFLQIPWDLKRIYQTRLRSMVEEWAGVPVEETVMYGLRQYTQGARLLTHVDRHATHAVSMIVNVAQGNLTEPWPVEVHDHADRLHEVLMSAGDVVYYESAKCLHGRNRPMAGPNAYYTNLFTHYKPIQEGDWWTDPNPEGTPEPVLGDRPLSEECQLVRKGIVASEGGHAAAFVQGVQCNNPSLGSFVSPDLFQATEPEDLIKWWRMTSPSSSTGSTTAAEIEINSSGNEL